MYISGYNRTLALLFHLGVAQTQGHEGLTQSSGPMGPWTGWDLHVLGSEPTQVKKEGKVP